MSLEEIDGLVCNLKIENDILLHQLIANKIVLDNIALIQFDKQIEANRSADQAEDPGAAAA